MLLTTTCSICNEPRVVEDPISPQPFTRPDCDLRNWNGSSYLWPEPVFGCYACGAAGTSLAGLDSTAQAVVVSDEYRNLIHDLPSRFRDEFAAGVLASEQHHHAAAFRRFLAASWIADATTESAIETDPAWQGLADRARRAAVDAWIAECGDIFDSTLQVGRSYEVAASTVVDEVMLDNLVLVDLLRRLSEWDRAAMALGVARQALSTSRADLAGWPLNGDADLVFATCALAFDLQDVLIANRQPDRAHAALDLPLWWAE